MIRTAARWSSCTALAALAAGCGAAGGVDAAELARVPVSFADYPYTPVGAFAAGRSADRGLPYADVNGDGRLDPALEATGRCEASGSCQIDATRVRLVSRTSSCPDASGLWWVGVAHDGRGRRIASRLCDESRSVCSADHPGVFRDTSSENGLWEPPPIAIGELRTVELRVGDAVVQSDTVEVPPPLALSPAELRFDGPGTGPRTVTATVDQRVDLAAMWMIRDGQSVWTSEAHRDMFEADGPSLTATLPAEAVRACGETCDTFLAVARVWRDDEVLVTSEILQRVQ